MKTHRLTPPLLLAILTVTLLSPLHAADSSSEFPLKAGDRVAWIGSSSTRIGTWCRTMEFLLRTRHPDLKLTFFRGTTGGGTFVTGVKNLPTWLGDFKPTVVLFNYGGNDAAAGPKGMPQFESNMQKCLDLVQSANARALFMTPQSADVRVSGQLPFELRKTYAERMLALGREKGWTVYDTHHPLETYQLDSRKEIPEFTINKDRIHLNDSAYVAWGLCLYEKMSPPPVESSAELSADGRVVAAQNCAIAAVSKLPSGGLEFSRADAVLPLLPPEPLPTGNALKPLPSTVGVAVGSAMKDTVKDIYNPSAAATATATQTGAAITPTTASTFDVKKIFVDFALGALQLSPSKPLGAPAFKMPAPQAAYIAKFGQQLPARTRAPLEKYSQYTLKISGLDAGQYEVSCEGKPIGRASEKELAGGINLNTLLLNSKNPAPWADLLKDVWIGKRLDEIGRTNWKFRVEKK